MSACVPSDAKPPFSAGARMRSAPAPVCTMSAARIVLAPARMLPPPLFFGGAGGALGAGEEDVAAVDALEDDDADVDALETAGMLVACLRVTVGSSESE